MVIQGSNGVDVVVRIWEKNKQANLTGATVELVIKTGARRMVKNATVISNGLVSVTLFAEDIATAGIYYVQARVNYSNGNSFISELGSFTIGDGL